MKKLERLFALQIEIRGGFWKCYALKNDRCYHRQKIIANELFVAKYLTIWPQIYTMGLKSFSRCMYLNFMKVFHLLRSVNVIPNILTVNFNSRFKYFYLSNLPIIFMMKFLNVIQRCRIVRKDGGAPSNMVGIICPPWSE